MPLRGWLRVRDAKRSVEQRVEEYWDWFAVALFLLITVDLLTSAGAAVLHGVDAEANPFMRWLLPRNIVLVTAVHLGVVVVAVLAFSEVVSAVERAPNPYDAVLERVVQVWLGLLVAGGLFLFANNLAVVVLGESLL